MSNAITDLGALGTQDYLGEYLNAFRSGQAAASGATPSAPSLASLTNAVTGRLAVGVGPEQDAAVRRAEILGALGIGLGGVPYAQRAPVLMHLAPALATLGVEPTVVTGFDPTDEALALSVERAQATARLLAGD